MRRGVLFGGRGGGGAPGRAFGGGVACGRHGAAGGTPPRRGRCQRSCPPASRCSPATRRSRRRRRRPARYALHAGGKLAPPVGGAERLEGWPGLVPTDVRVQGDSWRESGVDVAIAGGWVVPRLLFNKKKKKRRRAGG